MESNEFILCSIDVPTLINQNGVIDVAKVSDIHAHLGNLIRRIRQIPSGSKYIPDGMTKKGAFFENIHRSAIINDESLRFVVYLKDVSGNFELDIKDAQSQIVDLINDYLHEAIKEISLARASLLYVATPNDVVDLAENPGGIYAIIKSKNRQDAEMKLATMSLVNSIPSGATITLKSKNPSAQYENEFLLSKQRSDNLSILPATKQALADEAPFSVNGMLAGHFWSQGKVFINCDDNIIRKMGININNQQDLEKLKDEYCSNRKVTLMIKKDGNRGFQCVSVIKSASE